jgi:ribosomal protein S18 acetylase RimI-like enzyme
MASVRNRKCVAVCTLMMRPATLADIDALVALEHRCFTGDRISRRQWRYLLSKAHADTVVAVASGALQGYVLLLYNRATSVARLYSIAVAPEARRAGAGRRLVAAAERAARVQGRAYMRLEVRRDNDPSLALFKGLGYRDFGVLGDYYEDHMEALRFQKGLQPDLRPPLIQMPFYEQTLDFTCGACSLMMAMKALDAQVELNRTLELRIWREATTIFMASGHGGCGPFGLALAARHRGFGAEIYVNDPAVPLVDSVRSAEKKEVMRLVHEEMLKEVGELAIPVHYTSLPLEPMEGHFTAGAIPIVLISSYRIYGEKVPHWVVVTGFDTHFVYVNDPYVDRAEGETPVDSINIAIPKREFTRMARYGRSGLQAVVLLSRKPDTQRPACPGPSAW